MDSDCNCDNKPRASTRSRDFFDSHKYCRVVTTDWAANNNLTLNRLKSVEIVFVAPRSRRAVLVPSPAVNGFQRVDAIKMLGVTIGRRFSVTDHVDQLLAACAQTLFALRTLRQHGLPTDALQVIFQATVIAKLTYASPAWWGFASADDRARLVAFVRRSVRLGYCSASSPSLDSICAKADDRLFERITRNSGHLLHHLLPPPRDNHYELRHRSHNYALPPRTSTVNDCNFLLRMLYKDLNYSTFSQSG